MIDISSLSIEARAALLKQLTSDPHGVEPKAVSIEDVRAEAVAAVNRIMAIKPPALRPQMIREGESSARPEPTKGEKTSEYAIASDGMRWGKIAMGIGAVGPIVEFAQECVRTYQALPSASGHHDLGWLGVALVAIGAAKAAYVSGKYGEARSAVKAGAP